MPRAKAKPWEPVGTEAANVEDICTSNFFDNVIADNLGSVSSKSRIEIASRLKKLLGALRLRLAYRPRPAGGSKRVALGNVSKALDVALAAINGLDADSRRLIRLASEDDEGFEGNLKPQQWQLKPSDGQLYMEVDRHGDEYVAATIHHIEALARWIEAASSGIENSRAGKKAQSEEFAAVKKLMRIWKEYKGRDPSELELLNFSTEVLRPVLDLYPRVGTLAGHVHQCLYVAQ
jgi:hypothetical protein